MAAEELHFGQAAQKLEILPSAFGRFIRLLEDELGALLFVPLGEILRGQLGGVLPGLHYFLYGLAVVVIVLALPRGIAPSLAGLFGARRAVAPN